MFDGATSLADWLAGKLANKRSAKHTNGPNKPQRNNTNLILSFGRRRGCRCRCRQRLACLAKSTRVCPPTAKSDLEVATIRFCLLWTQNELPASRPTISLASRRISNLATDLKRSNFKRRNVCRTTRPLRERDRATCKQSTQPNSRPFGWLAG